MVFKNGIIGSQLNKYLTMGFGLDRLGSVGEYSANNSWNFNGSYRILNNNNRYNSNFRSRPCSDNISTCEPISHCLIPLEDIQYIEEECKSNKPNCTRFRVNKTHGIIQVWHQINNMDVEITEAMRFIATVPKLREIVYCHYSDKLIQSFYVFSLNYYLETNWFDDNSFSCRMDKGVLKAVETYRGYIAEALEKYDQRNIFLASLDIERFFLNIDTKLLAENMIKFIEVNIKDQPTRELLIYLTKCLYIIDWHSINIVNVDKNETSDIPLNKTLLYGEPYIGVPTGNWPSQIGGNFITTFALIFIRGLGYNMFVHYTDDTCFVIIDKKKFLNDIKIIENFYNEVLHLKLHKNKRYLQHVSKGITMLGRRIKFNRCIASKRTINSIDSLVYGICNNYPKNKKYVEQNLESFSQSINSYGGMLIHMTMFNYQKTILNNIKNTLGQYYTIDTKNYSKINIKRRYKTQEKYIYYIKQKKEKQ